MKYNINKANNLTEVLNTIREQKGLTKEEMLNFVNFRTPMINPYLLNNMDKAIYRLQQAIFDQEPICIIGDYDVDGLTATTIMYKTFKNFMPVYYIIPNRLTDGYGISKTLVDKAKKFNVNLLITVDNGISGQEAINYAHLLGMEIIVTDHHLALDNDFPADITIDPQIDNYPFKGICGCMVAYKICSALFNHLNIPYNDKEFVELTTLATIADVMPLINENRTLVNKGLKYLENADNIGLKTLINKLKIRITTEQLAWFICPCLNAAGRMDTPDHVMNLFLSNTIEEAEEKAQKLIDLNNERKKYQDQIMENIIIDDSHKVIFAHIPTQINGIAGIIASKIQDKYNKPCFALGGVDKLSGSGRSNGFPLDSIIKNCELVEGGGHSEACGITLNKKDLPIIQQKADELFDLYIPEDPVINLIQIPISLINKELVEALQALQPFGKDNENPLFTSTTYIESTRVVGKNQNCTQFTFSEGWYTAKGIMFDTTDIKNGQVEVIYTLEFNEFPRGVFTPQMQIKEIRKAVS